MLPRRLGKLLYHPRYFFLLIGTSLPLFELGVHKPEPQGWYVTDENHERVAKWQLGRFVEVAQYLIGPGRISVVVGMALELK